ncbi:hypothetical protein FKM82_004989 [Ascaphus truei]
MNRLRIKTIWKSCLSSLHLLIREVPILHSDASSSLQCRQILLLCRILAQIPAMTLPLTDLLSPSQRDPCCTGIVNTFGRAFRSLGRGLVNAQIPMGTIFICPRISHADNNF